VCFRSKYFTEELRRIFKEDTDSEMEDFEGFTESELNMSSNPEVTVVMASTRGVDWMLKVLILIVLLPQRCYIIHEKM
jgi:hypothetical protein